MSHPRVTFLRVAGFRSLKDVTLKPGPVTVLIGPNGSGKSNLLSAIELLQAIVRGNLQTFVHERGGASYLLHYGPKVTDEVGIQIELATDAGEYAYCIDLGYGADESLFIRSERVASRPSTQSEWRWDILGSGRESKLRDRASYFPVEKDLHSLVGRIGHYHFADTSRRSPLRTRDYTGARGRSLQSDGSNLPAFLYRLRESPAEDDRAAWRLIEGTVRRIAPFIRQLVPEEDAKGVRLEWIDAQGARFGPSHLSDGTLRAIALVASLAQPSSTRPFFCCIDEPELGLHPAALNLVASLMQSVSSRSQVLVATQSPELLDAFEPDDVVVVEQSRGETSFKRLSSDDLAAWLEDYSLSELYDKNVLGGRP